MRIYVGNLSYKTTTVDLEAYFSEFGTVNKVEIPIDRDTNRARGFGFVDMHDEAEANVAINRTNGVAFMGRELNVNEARPREDRPRGRQGSERGRNQQQYDRG